VASASRFGLAYDPNCPKAQISFARQNDLSQPLLFGIVDDADTDGYKRSDRTYLIVLAQQRIVRRKFIADCDSRMPALWRVVLKDPTLALDFLPIQSKARE